MELREHGPCVGDVLEHLHAERSVEVRVVDAERGRVRGTQLDVAEPAQRRPASASIAWLPSTPTTEPDGPTSPASSAQ